MSSAAIEKLRDEGALMGIRTAHVALLGDCTDAHMSAFRQEVDAFRNAGASDSMIEEVLNIPYGSLEPLLQGIVNGAQIEKLPDDVHDQALRIIDQTWY